MIEVEEYIDRLGRNAFRRWVGGLDSASAARVLTLIDRVESGNRSSMKGIGSGLFELRLDSGPGYRVYCGRYGETLVILLGGGTKRRQQDDIEAARILWHEYKERKRQELL